MAKIEITDDKGEVLFRREGIPELVAKLIIAQATPHLNRLLKTTLPPSATVESKL
jgi:hypothetical protein